MIKVTQISILDYILLVSAFIFLSFGSLGFYRELFIFLGLANTVVAIGIKLIRSGSVVFPKYFSIYSAFLLTLFIHTELTHGNIMFFWIFVSGGLFWLETFLYREIFTKYFSFVIIGLGILMALAYFYSLINPINVSSLVSLFTPASETAKHSDIGDLWAIVLTTVFYLYSKNKPYYLIPLIILGIYLLGASLSRSALISFATGAFYIFYKSGLRKDLKKPLIFLGTSLVVLFIYMGLTKTILFSRTAYIESIVGLFKYPLGTGLGNFAYVSKNSTLAHNIILEIVSGMGVFSVVFLVWLYKVIKDLFLNKKNIAMVAVFLATLVDFSFHTSYTIISFVWILFMALGLSQENNKIID